MLSDLKTRKNTDQELHPGLFRVLILLHSAVASEVVSPVWAEDVDDFYSAVIGSDHFAVADIDSDVGNSCFIRAREEYQVPLLWRAYFRRHVIVTGCACAGYVVASFVKCIGDKSAAVESCWC